MKGSDKCYWEVVLGDYVYSSQVGIRSEPEDWEILWRGDEISLFRNNSSRSRQYMLADDNATHYNKLSNNFKSILYIYIVFIDFCV